MLLLLLLLSLSLLLSPAKDRNNNNDNIRICCLCPAPDRLEQPLWRSFSLFSRYFVVAVSVVVAQLNPSTPFKLHESGSGLCQARCTGQNSAQNKLFFLLSSVLCSHLKLCLLSAKFLNNAQLSGLDSGALISIPQLTI